MFILFWLSSAWAGDLVVGGARMEQPVGFARMNGEIPGELEMVVLDAPADCSVFGTRDQGFNIYSTKALIMTFDTSERGARTLQVITPTYAKWDGSAELSSTAAVRGGKGQVVLNETPVQFTLCSDYIPYVAPTAALSPRKITIVDPMASQYPDSKQFTVNMPFPTEWRENDADSNWQDWVAQDGKTWIMLEILGGWTDLQQEFPGWVESQVTSEPDSPREVRREVTADSTVWEFRQNVLGDVRTVIVFVQRPGWPHPIQCRVATPEKTADILKSLTEACLAMQRAD